MDGQVCLEFDVDCFAKVVNCLSEIVINVSFKGMKVYFLVLIMMKFKTTLFIQSIHNPLEI